MHRPLLFILVIGSAGLAACQECTTQEFCFEGTFPNGELGSQIPCAPPTSPLPQNVLVCVCAGGATVSCIACVPPGASFSQVCPNQMTSNTTNVTCGTSVTDYNWDPLVSRACNNYNAAVQGSSGSGAIGYYGQVLNIVCAAAKSMDAACCGQMFPSYDSSSVCAQRWAGPFIYSVFNSFLGSNGRATQASVIGSAIDAGASGLLPYPLLNFNYLIGRDLGSLIAGFQHLLHNLWPAFYNYILNMESCFAADCDQSGLDNEFSSIDNEHELFFECAVYPGFVVEAARGDLASVSVSIAQTVVPIIAGLARQFVEFWAEVQFVHVCQPELGFGPIVKRHTIQSSSSITNAAAVASLLNLTIPQEAPLAFDPRAWVPATSAQPSVVPFSHFQILPSSPIYIDVKVPDSTACVQISADRSSLPSEATVVLSVNSAGSNPLFPVGPFTLPGNNISVFGVLTILAPSTFPISSDYLFAPPGMNISFAQSLNESSFDPNYNFLFHTFDLAITYDPTQVTKGMKPSNFVIVDLVAGVKIPSTVDPSQYLVTASGIAGHPDIWGGGGVYALGY